MKTIYYFTIAALFTACTAAKIQVPQAFRSQSTQYPVKGLQGFTINQTLRFGPFETSRIRRGWDFTGGIRHTDFGFSLEKQVLRLFDVEQLKGKQLQRNQFQFSLFEGRHQTEVLAMEKFEEKNLVYRSKHALIDGITRTNQFNYSFSAAIVPVDPKNPEPWQLVMLTRYDAAKDKAPLGARRDVEEEGYITNGSDVITIRPLRLDQVTTRGGKQARVFGGSLLSGFELRIDDGVIGIVDILDNSLWLYNELEAPLKRVSAAAAAALLLRRVQDPQQTSADLP